MLVDSYLCMLWLFIFKVTMMLPLSGQVPFKIIDSSLGPLKEGEGGPLLGLILRNFVRCRSQFTNLYPLLALFLSFCLF